MKTRLEEKFDLFCNIFSIRKNDILGDVRSFEFVEARIAWSIHLRNLHYSYPFIGRFLKRDHTTIVHYLKRGLKSREAVSNLNIFIEKIKSDNNNHT